MTAWPKENNQDVATKIILFLISPFLSFLFSLRTMKTRSSYVVFFLFAVFFGMAFSVPSGKTLEFMGDGASYREKFDYYQYVHGWEFLEDLEGFLSFDEGNKDFYFDTVAFFTSRFTDNYHFMFMFFAIVFAIFMLKSFKILTSEDNFNLSFASFVLAYWFTINGIFNINGMRFWTATWIGVYAILQIFQKENKKYWLLVLVTPFFHGSFWIFIGVLLLAQFTRKYEKAWVALFIISFFISNIAIELIQYIQDFLPAFLSRLVDSYTDSEYVEQRSSMGGGMSWIPYMFGIIGRVYRSLLIYLFIKESRMIRANKKTENLYLFLLVWATVFNFFSFVPSLGGRFISLVWPMIAYIWIVNFKDYKYKKFLYAMPFIFAWSLYEKIGLYSSVLNFEFFFSNPFVLIYKYLIIA